MGQSFWSLRRFRPFHVLRLEERACKLPRVVQVILVRSVVIYAADVVENPRRVHSFAGELCNNAKPRSFQPLLKWLVVVVERTTPSGKDERVFVEWREVIDKIEQALMMLSVVNTGANADQVAILKHGYVNFTRRAHLSMEDIGDRIRDFFRIAVVQRNTDNDRFHSPLSYYADDDKNQRCLSNSSQWSTPIRRFIRISIMAPLKRAVKPLYLLNDVNISLNARDDRG
jgi:hypothetical protein